jgi:aminoglycoside 2''-phosphotransferase
MSHRNNIKAHEDLSSFLYERKTPISPSYCLFVNPQELIEIIERDTGLEVYHYKLLTDGWDNLVLEVNRSLIFRFARRMDVLNQLIKELKLLPLLNRRLTIRVPNPLYHQTAVQPYYMAYEKIHGEPVTGSVNKEYLVETVTVFLRELQAVDHKALEHIPRYTPDTWRREYSLLHERIVREVYPSLEFKVCERINNEFTGFIKAGLEFEPTLCHGDLPEHILELDGRITGIIDWGDACVGDPAFDLTGLLMDYGEKVAKSISDNLDYTSEHLVRARFYSKVAPFYEALYGLKQGDKMHIKKGLEKINKTFRKP